MRACVDRKLDVDKDGFITKEELAMAFSYFNLYPTPKEVDELYLPPQNLGPQTLDPKPPIAESVLPSAISLEP